MIFSENRYSPIGSWPEGMLFRIMLWRAAVDEPALKMPAAEMNAAPRSVAITSAHVAADPSGGVLGRGIQSD